MLKLSTEDKEKAIVRICKIARTLDLYRNSYADGADLQMNPSQCAEKDEEETSTNEADYNYDAFVKNVRHKAVFTGRTNTAVVRRRTMKSKFVPANPTSERFFSSHTVSHGSFQMNGSDLSSSRYINKKTQVCIIVLVLIFHRLNFNLCLQSSNIFKKMVCFNIIYI